MGSIDPDGRSAINRQYYEAHQEEIRRKHRDYWKTYKRPSRARTVGSGAKQARPRTREGHAVWQWISEAWKRQGGLCYLCGDPISIESVPRTAFVEHDHNCCQIGRSCPGCRRGLSCQPCNTVLGFVHDDLDRLELIARNAREAWSR